MQKVQNLFPVYKVETNDALINLSEERGQLYVRVAIMPTGDATTLTDAQRDMLEKLSDAQKEVTLRGQLSREISSIFPVTVFAPYVHGLESVQLDEESQKAVVSELSELLTKPDSETGKKEVFIFTYYTESVETLLKGTEYDGVKTLYSERTDGTVATIRQRNNLYFGFFDDEQDVFDFMQSRTLAAIDDDTLLVNNPNGDVSTKQPTDTSQKPRLTLRRLQRDGHLRVAISLNPFCKSSHSLEF